MNHRTPRTLCCFLALAAILSARAVHAQALGTPKDEVKAFTEPEKRSQMNFREIGIVKRVPVKEGQAVKKNDILMVLDTEIDQANAEEAQKDQVTKTLP